MLQCYKDLKNYCKDSLNRCEVLDFVDFFGNLFFDMFDTFDLWISGCLDIRTFEHYMECHIRVMFENEWGHVTTRYIDGRFHRPDRFGIGPHHRTKRLRSGG